MVESRPPRRRPVPKLPRLQLDDQVERAEIRAAAADPAHPANRPARAWLLRATGLPERHIARIVGANRSAVHTWITMDRFARARILRPFRLVADELPDVTAVANQEGHPSQSMARAWLAGHAGDSIKMIMAANGRSRATVYRWLSMDRGQRAANLLRSQVGSAAPALGHTHLAYEHRRELSRIARLPHHPSFSMARVLIGHADGETFRSLAPQVAVGAVTLGRWWRDYQERGLDALPFSLRIEERRRCEAGVNCRDTRTRVIVRALLTIDDGASAELAAAVAGTTPREIRSWCRRVATHRLTWLPELPTTQRDSALTLARDPGMSYRVIGARLDMHPDTVRAQVRADDPPLARDRMTYRQTRLRGRRARVLDYLTTHPLASIRAAADRFSIAEATIHRWIAELDQHDLHPSFRHTPRLRDAVNALADDQSRPLSQLADLLGRAEAEIRRLLTPSQAERRGLTWWSRQVNPTPQLERQLLDGVEEGEATPALRRAALRVEILKAVLASGLRLSEFQKLATLGDEYVYVLIASDVLPSVAALRRIEAAEPSFRYDTIAETFADLGYPRAADCTPERWEHFADLLGRARRYAGLTRPALTDRTGAEPLEIVSYERNTSQPTESFVARLLHLRLAPGLGPEAMPALVDRFQIGNRHRWQSTGRAEVFGQTTAYSRQHTTELHRDLAELEYGSAPWRATWERLTEIHLDIADRCAQRLMGARGGRANVLSQLSLEREDAQVVARLALSTSILEHDPRHPVAFPAGAQRRVEQILRRWAADQNPISSTAHDRYSWIRAERARQRLTARSARTATADQAVTDADVATELGVLPETVTGWRAHRDAWLGALSQRPNTISHTGEYDEAGVIPVHQQDQGDPDPSAELRTLAASAQIPPEILEVLVLHIGQGIPVPEIVRRTGRDPATLRQEIADALTRLRHSRT